MWMGFSVPFVLGCIKGLHNYFEFIPTIEMSLGHIPMFRGMEGIGFNFSPSIVGFSYFIPQNVAAGFGFFWFLNQVQQGFQHVFGWQTQETAMGEYSMYADPMIIHQSMGAMIVLVLGTLYVGRSHLKAVWSKAVQGNPEVDDSDEIISYRNAVLGTLLSFTVMGAWLWQSGIPLLYVPLLLFGGFVVFITITRVVAQGGVAAIYPPTCGPDFVVSAVGATNLGRHGLAGLALSYPWNVDTLILFMSACANGLKLMTEVGPANRRRLFWGIVAVIILTPAVSIALNIYLGYQYGGINLEPFYFRYVAWLPYIFMEKNIHMPEGPNLNGWIHKGIGASVMTVLMMVQRRFAWWPFHPLGYPISVGFRSMFFSVFVAWLCKTMVLRYGGVNLFNRLKPFFVGLVLGSAAVGGIWVVIDYFTGTQNNVLGGVVH